MYIRLLGYYSSKNTIQEYKNIDAYFVFLLTHWSINKMAAILQTSWSAFTWEICILSKISLKFVPRCPVDIRWGVGCLLWG